MKKLIGSDRIISLFQRKENSEILQVRVERNDIIKRTTLALSIVFIILTFVGTGYILYNSGKVNAGYAVVPKIFALINIVAYT